MTKVSQSKERLEKRKISVEMANRLEHNFQAILKMSKMNNSTD